MDLRLMLEVFIAIFGAASVAYIAADIIAVYTGVDE